MSAQVRKRNERVINIVISGLREMGRRGATSLQLRRSLAARHGDTAVPGRTLATVLGRAARHGYLDQDSRGRYSINTVVASRCGCKPKKPKRKSCRKKKSSSKKKSCSKKKKVRSKCRKEPGLVKRLMRIIFKKKKNKCKCPPKKCKPRKPRC